MDDSDGKNTRSLGLWQTLKIVVFAILLALLLRLFVLEGFHIPSESMERTLLVGDFVLVSKLHYGPRLPMSLGIPFTTGYIPGIDLPYLRLPGLTRPRRGDVVVFNYPVEAGPVDQKMHFIKRLVGLPGDSVAVQDKQLVVNGEAVPMLQGMMQQWLAHPAEGFRISVDSLRARKVTRIIPLPEGKISFEATLATAEEVASWEAVASVGSHAERPRGSSRTLFPRDRNYSSDWYGPLYVPAKGDTLYLDPDNWSAYRDLITRYEHHEATLLPDSTVQIDGLTTPFYVVTQDYYFVLGDSRDNSVDSRVWGFVPEDHLVGKAAFLYFSLDPDLGQVRAERIFQKIR